MTIACVEMSFEAERANLGEVMIVYVCVNAEETSKDRLDGSLEVGREWNA